MPRGREMTFEQFVAFCRRQLHVGKLSFAEYSAASKVDRGVDKDSTWFIPAQFIRPERRADAVGSLTGFVCDFDDGAIGRAEIETRLAAYAHVAWTSYSHGVSGISRWRAFIPYATPVTPKEHKAHYEYFNQIFEGHLDPRCATTSQLWYLPGHPGDAPAHEIFALVDGPYFVLPAVDRSKPVARTGGLSGNAPVSILAAGIAANKELSAQPPPSLRDIESALGALDTVQYGDYSRWLEIGMAVFDGTQGSQDGFELFDTWSRRCPGYMEGATQAKWQSFGGTRNGPRITIATLFGEAKKAGWTGGVDNPPGQPSAPAAPAPSGLQEREPPKGTQRPIANCQQPAQLVLPLIVTAPVPMPDSWQNSKVGFSIQKKVEDESGENMIWKTVIRGFRALNLELLEAVVDESNTAQLTAESHNKVRTATFNTALMAAPSDFKALLNERGIYCRMEEFKELQELLVDWLKKIQEQNRVKRSFTHYGWMEKDGTPVGFAHGNTAYYTDGSKETGIKVATKGGSPHAPFYIPQGQIQPWRDVTTFLAHQNNQSLLAVLATSFASPLMKFSGHSGAVVSIVSSASGVGKSSVLLASQAVWGQPGATVHAATDTILSLASKMGFTRNLPAYWDDVKGNDKMWGAFAEMVYQVTQGKEKSRLDQSANPRAIQEWCCLAVIAANDSIFEVMKRYSKGGTDSGVARVFEIRLEERPTAPVPGTFFEQCRTNYGWAGAAYSAWLAKNRATAEKYVIAKTAALTAELNMASEERFWIASMATMVVGAAIAKMLGLVDFDVPALEAFLKNNFLELRNNKTKAAKETGPEDQINSMIFDHQQTTLVVDTIPRYNSGTTMIVRPPRNQEVEITFIKNDQILRVRRTKFNEWCMRRGHSPETLRIELDRLGALKEKNVDPMVGMKPYTLDKRVACYDIDLKKLGLTGDADDSSGGDAAGS